MTVLAHAHGGDLDAIQRTYGIPKEEIIDFSGNINPLGFPKRAEDALKENLHLICTCFKVLHHSLFLCICYGLILYYLDT